MAEDIKYSLGLDAMNFLGPLRGAIAGLTAFIGVGAALGLAMKGVWSAIEEGGRLQDLSSRTGMAVKDLYQLQTAFGQAGLSGEEVAPMVLRLQRALAGMSDDGSKAGKVFSQMGLDVDELKKMGAAEQITKIGETLATLDRSSAVDAASKIFGRQGFGGILQIAGDIEGFKEGMAAAAASAEIFARSAAAFDRIGDTIALIRMKVQGMFAGIAEGIVPLVQAIANLANSIDWVGIGTRIGTVFRAFGKAIESGRLGEMLSLTLSVGLERFLLVFHDILQAMMIMIKSTLGNPDLWKAVAATFSASIADAISGVAKWLSKLAPFAGGGLLKEDAKFFSQAGDLMREEANTRFTAAIGKGIKDALDGDFLSLTATDLSRKWWSTAAALGGALPGAVAGKQPNCGGQVGDRSGKVPEANALERIGFIFGGGASVQEQNAAATARNTAEGNKTLVEIKQAILKSSMAGLGFAHL
jgi:hypothetical protein